MGTVSHSTLYDRNSNDKAQILRRGEVFVGARMWVACIARSLETVEGLIWQIRCELLGSC